MIARLLSTAASLLVLFCAATLIAQAVILAYLWSAWDLDRDKLDGMLAVARGIEAPGDDETSAEADQVSPEQVSYEQILDQRALKFRDLELRELALNNALDQLRFHQQQLAQNQEQQKKSSQELQNQLKSLQEGAEATGRDVVLRTLESLKPSQAKEQLFQMLDGGEIEQVVLLLSEMNESKRAKILAEFKTPEEGEKLAEVLRLIWQGDPESSLAEEVIKQLEPLRSSGA